MGLLQDLSLSYKTISIVGMAKNAGKTTALNYFIEEAMDSGLVLGITSTGRDGESIDLVTGTDKPKVYLDEGTIVSVPTKLYELAQAGLEILKITSYHTSLGPTMICRVAESGYVQVAGPVATADHLKLCKEMRELGAQVVLIDGAVDRKSIANPDISEAVILSTGAVLSRSLRKVAEETAHVVNLYGLPVPKDSWIREQIKNRESENCILFFNKISSEDGAEDSSYRVEAGLKTGLEAGLHLDEAIGENTECIYLPGALTSGMLAQILPTKLKHIKFILKDPTKIFIDSTT